jgi:hypothetical protein
MKMKKLRIGIATLLIFILPLISKAQVISQLGIWNNNANFVIKYYQDKVITSTTSGIKFIDVSNPSNPTPTASFGTTPAFPMSIAIDNNYAFFGGGMTPYFMIADISDINFPVQKGITYSLSGTSGQISIKGNYAFMTTTSDTLYSIDISDKTNPTVVGKLNVGSSPRGIAIKGNYAYVGTTGGLKVVDISNSINMNVVNTFGSGYSYLDSDLPNNRLFVSKTNGFDVIDIFNPTVPSPLFQGIGGNSSGSIAYKDGYAFQTGSSVVSVFQIGSASATYLSSFNVSEQVIGVTAKDSVFYLSSVNNLRVLKIGTLVTSVNTDLTTDVINCYPNPAGNLLTIEGKFISPTSTILISNCTGQIIKKIVSGFSNVVQLDLSELTSGIYFVSLINPNSEKRIKFIKK